MLGGLCVEIGFSERPIDSTKSAIVKGDGP
jgi:hypothetical protein